MKLVRQIIIKATAFASLATITVLMGSQLNRILGLNASALAEITPHSNAIMLMGNIGAGVLSLVLLSSLYCYIKKHLQSNRFKQGLKKARFHAKLRWELFRANIRSISLLFNFLVLTVITLLILINAIPDSETGNQTTHLVRK